MAKKSKSRISRKQILTIVLVVGVLVIAAGVGFLVRWLQTQGDNQKKDDENINIVDAIPRSVSEAQNLSAQGKYDEALSELDKSLSDPSRSDDEKFEIYSQQGATYENQQDYDKALEAYQKAASVRKTSGIYKSIGRVAEEKGDKKLALDSYKESLALLNRDDNPLYDFDKAKLEEKIRALGG